MLNLYLQIPCSNINKYTIRFPQDKQMSELFEWIYDNFNQFFKVENKNQLNIQKNGQQYRSSNQLLSSCLRDNDVLVIGEVKIGKLQLQLLLVYEYQISEILIEEDITIQELMEFIYCTFQISNNLKVDLIYENLNLSNYNKTKKLAEFNLQSKAKIIIIPIHQFDNQLINLQIVCRDQGCSIQRQFNKSDTLNTIINSIQSYIGLNDNTVAFSVFIKGKCYNDDNIRKQTLAQLKLEDDDVVEIKIRYCGGK